MGIPGIYKRTIHYYDVGRKRRARTKEASITNRLSVFQTLTFWSTTELEGELPITAEPIQWLEPMELCTMILVLRPG